MKILASFSKKVQVILVDGELHIDSNDGKYFTKVNVETFAFVGSKNETQQTSTQETQQVETNDFTETKADFSSTMMTFMRVARNCLLTKLSHFKHERKVERH